MKSSRLRGAALAWGTLFASGTALAQMPYQGTYAPYPAAPYAAPYGHSANSALPMQTQPAPGVSFLPAARQSNQGVTSLIGEPPVSVLTSPQQNIQYPNPATLPAYPDTSVANPYGQAIQQQPGIAGPGSYVSQGSPAQIPGVPASPYGGVAPQGAYGGQAYEQLPYSANGIGTGIGGGYGYGSGGGYGYGSGGYGMGAAGSLGMGAGAAYAYGGGMGCGVGQGMGWQGYGAGAGAGAYGCGFDACAAPRAPSWYAGVYGMWLSSSRQDHYTFSYDDANEELQFTDAKDANFNWEPGLAVVVGHYFNCGANAIEFVYWNWFPDDAAVYTYSTLLGGGNLNGILNWDDITYAAQPGDFWVNNAEVHAVFRDVHVSNYELNLLKLSNAGGACYYSPWQYSLIAGFRYFRFDDHLTFGSDISDEYFNGDAAELFYDIRTINNLWGFQIGGVGTYCVGPRLSFNAGTKFGIFANHITHSSWIGGSQGLATINNGPFNGREWIVRSDKDDVSFLGEVFVGGSYCINRWTLSAGYRAIAVTGLAQPTDQIYSDLRGINDVESIESNSSVILHGMYFGGQFCF